MLLERSVAVKLNPRQHRAQELSKNERKGLSVVSGLKQQGTNLLLRLIRTPGGGKDSHHDEH